MPKPKPSQPEPATERGRPFPNGALTRLELFLAARGPAFDALHRAQIGAALEALRALSGRAPEDGVSTPEPHEVEGPLRQCEPLVPEGHRRGLALLRTKIPAVS